jgi:hypothetical protein
MAAGSHLEKGICALLVSAAKVIARRRRGEKLLVSVCRIIQCP